LSAYQTEEYTLNPKELLKHGAAEIGVNLDDQAIANLWKYKDFMLEYNQKVNLTAITDECEIVTKHFLDCITLVPHITQNARVIDIGTGAGLPGVVLKIARPDLDITLLDARAKKLKFLDEAIGLLGLKNIRTIHGRAEDIQKQTGFGSGFDYAVSRAVGAMEVLSGWCLPFVKKGGKFIAMKGPNYKDELDKAKPIIKRLSGEIGKVLELTLPSEEITRNLIFINKK